jgi:uncharacterized protein (TIGR02147 family)
LKEIPAGQRDVSSLTLGLRRDQIPLLKKKIQEFRREILKIASLAEKTEDVVQLSIQMFPLTKEGEKKS